MYKDPGILCATPTDIFFNGFRPNQKPFCGCWGCLASLRSSEHLPARPQPPRGWADGGRPRGLRPDHSRVPPVSACGSGCLHGRRANVVRPEQAEAPGSAPWNRGSDPRLIGAGNSRPDIRCRGANLEDVYYSWRTAIQFKETGIPGCSLREVESASATRDS